ncbi:MAG: alpha/beta hydrolase [Planctomycetia bacterium]|nr:alpha/beta hydrolase [Planctomycetia bacterium]
MYAKYTLWLLLAGLMSHATAISADDAPVKKSVQAADGVNIYCEVTGKGETTLLFLHGWCGDHEYWKHQVKEFAPQYQIVTIDQAGHGESGKNRTDWTIDSLAGDVEAVVKQLGLKRVILIGHSMGGPVSLAAAKRMPGKVVAVIGVDTLQNVEFQMPKEIVEHFTKQFETDFGGTLKNAIGSMLTANADAELKQWITTRALAQDQKMAASLMKNLMSQDPKTLLKEAKVPVRCINSAGGFQLHTPTAVDINKKYADYNAVTIPEVGHYPMLEKPKEFNQKLQDVLKEFAKE